jgi:alternate signal-mediated exported protein
MPGDVLELRQDVVANLVGDNLQAKVTLTWDGRQSAVVPGMAITYHIEDSDHNQIAPASGESPVGGAAITITGATEGEDRYTVVITLTYDPATAPPTNSSVDPSSDGAGQAVIKRLYLTAQQVRGA